MSHFSVFVILPERNLDPDDVNEMLEKALRKFDENLDASECIPKEIDCFCRYNPKTRENDLPAEKDCKNCNGTGRYTVYENPNGSKWDWWVWGGRWDGYLVNNVMRVESIIDLNEWKKKINEERDLSEKDDGYIYSPSAFAYVTPEGEWIEKGEMGWWAMVSEEKDDDEWENIVDELMIKYEDHYAYCVDCHI